MYSTVHDTHCVLNRLQCGPVETGWDKGQRLEVENELAAHLSRIELVAATR